MQSSSLWGGGRKQKSSSYQPSGTGERPLPHSILTSLTASSEVFSPTQIDDDSGDEGPDPDSL